MPRAQNRKFENLIYTILTTLIIMLGKFRDRTCKSHTTSCFRSDRTIPWNKDLADNILLMGCCDCGLAHFLIPGHSVTPIRTVSYSYKFRLGANSWHKPDTSLSEYACEKAQKVGIIE